MGDKPTPYKVLLLEDENATRVRLAAAIAAHPELILTDAVATCAQAYESLQKTRPDIFISDLGLPDGSGIKVIFKAKALYPDIEILVVTMFGDEENVVAALEAGASGYLLKKQAFEELASAAISLLHGESTISPEVARFLLKRFKKEPPSSVPQTAQVENPLTSRELDVLKLIAKGFSYDEIAAAYSLSTNTVRSHIRNIYRKLSVCSRSEAVFEASQLGFIELL